MIPQIVGVVSIECEVASELALKEVSPEIFWQYRCGSVHGPQLLFHYN